MILHVKRLSSSVLQQQDVGEMLKHVSYERYAPEESLKIIKQEILSHGELFVMQIRFYDWIFN